jgi:hypothetical protein
MKLDFSKIPQSVNTVEKLIIYLLLCLDEGELNTYHLKRKALLKVLCDFKLDSLILSGNLWDKVKEFKDIPFKPYTGIPSPQITLPPIPTVIFKRRATGRIMCQNTSIIPREETRLNFTIFTDLDNVEIKVSTNSPYVFERFDLSKINLLNCSNLRMNEDKSGFMIHADGQVSQIILPSIDTVDTVNFHFPLFIEVIDGYVEKNKDMVIINMTNQFPEFPNDGLTKFLLGGREWTLEYDAIYRAHTLRAACYSSTEYQRLSGQSYKIGLGDKLTEILGKPVKLLPSSWSNPESIYSTGQVQTIIYIQFFYVEA